MNGCVNILIYVCFVFGFGCCCCCFVWFYAILFDLI